ncbi:MAG: bifunctional 3-(3-hydroxy-phenyl)propionate/3-hydroxycinnamic acid hydroxylase [Pseudomonadota bacterium]
MTNYDVAIVGLGPTGATLANLLGQCGVNVLVLEREAAAYHLPRAIHFDGEIMRILQWIGVAEEIEPLTALHPGMQFVDRDGRLLLDWPRPQGVGPQGWRTNYRFHQPDLERLLRARADALKTVSILNQCEVVTVEDKGDHVDIRYKDLVDQQTHDVSAEYVVGCDGARSVVRGCMQTDMEDLGFHERWLVIDVILNQEKPELGDHSIQYCVPERPATYVRGPGMRRRWEITVLDDEDAEDISSPDSVWRLLSQWLTPEEAVLERSAVYVFHSLLAQKWRKGRLFLAGDSCHQTPPFMGQGMCAGLRDAANLYWKLAAACRSPDDDANRLLDTYESERKPNAREYIETAIRLGGLINTAGTENALRAAIPNPGGGTHMKSIAPPLGPGLGRGPSAGKLFGQPMLDDGRKLDEAYTHGFIAISQSELAAAIAVPHEIPIITTDKAPAAAQHLDALDAKAVVLRPDRYVLAGANSAEELDDLLAYAASISVAQPALT